MTKMLWKWHKNARHRLRTVRDRIDIEMKKKIRKKKTNRATTRKEKKNTKKYKTIVTKYKIRLTHRNENEQKKGCPAASSKTVIVCISFLVSHLCDIVHLKMRCCCWCGGHKNDENGDDGTANNKPIAFFFNLNSRCVALIALIKSVHSTPSMLLRMRTRTREPVHYFARCFVSFLSLMHRTCTLARTRHITHKTQRTARMKESQWK